MEQEKASMRSSRLRESSQSIKYEKRSAVPKLVGNHECYGKADLTRPKTRKLTEGEIEKIHMEFIKAGGCIRKTAHCTGFSRSTISKYARSRSWQDQLPQTNAKPVNQRKGTRHKTKENHDETLANLKMLRQILFEQIMECKEPEKTSETALKIPPNTLSEAIKALIDIDKRIAERKTIQDAEISDPYQIILTKCAKMVDVNPE